MPVARLKYLMGTKLNVFQNETEIIQQKHLSIHGGETHAQLRQ